MGSGQLVAGPGGVGRSVPGWLVRGSSVVGGGGGQVKVIEVRGDVGRLHTATGTQSGLSLGGERGLKFELCLLWHQAVSWIAMECEPAFHPHHRVKPGDYIPSIPQTMKFEASCRKHSHTVWSSAIIALITTGCGGFRKSHSHMWVSTTLPHHCNVY